MSRMLLLCIMITATCLYGQVAIISGKGPSYPVSADSVQFVIQVSAQKHTGTKLCTSLPRTWLDDCRNNIDTTLHYIDAVKLHRKEISGCGPKHQFDSYLVFYANKKKTMTISFSCRKYHGGMLNCALDKYPFVVVFKPGFMRKLEQLSARTAEKGKQ